MARTLLAASLALASAAHAQSPAADAVPADTSTGLTLAPAAVTFDDPPKVTPKTDSTPAPVNLDDSSARLKFGDAGFTYIALGGGLANNGEDMDENIFASYGYFIAKDVEFFGELGAWQYSQEGKDSTGFNASMVIRWHFIDHPRWTLFTDIGIGVLAATDPVNRRNGVEGTKFNFTPRLGGGYTRQITDDGVRLEVGLRWAHVSNARISGNDENPGRDSMMLYAGIIFPF